MVAAAAKHNAELLVKSLYLEMGRDEERERIIKLLEENMPHSLDHYLPCWQCQIVALIKGENK